MTYLGQFKKVGSDFKLKYGEDFNISYTVYDAWLGVHSPVNLTFGENLIPGSNLTIRFEGLRLLRGLGFKIRPMDFSFGMPVSYKLGYTFPFISLLNTKLFYG